MLKVLTVTGIEKKHTYMKRYGNLIPEIITRENLEASFNEVTCDLAPWSKKHFLEHKEKIFEELQKSIGDGSFRITRFEEFEVVDGPKRRKVQSPPVKERIGCNAVMRVVEKYVYPTVIPTSAASIPGRGMHYLFKKMRSDVSNNPEECTFFYKCDIKKFYESDTGKAYYHDWLLRHPEYQQPDTPNGVSGCSVHSSKNNEVSIL